MLPAMAETTFAKRSDHSSFASALIEKNVFRHEYTADSVIVTLSIALALYNSLEMVLLISSTFKKRRGLYYWSLTICNYGVMLYALGMLLSYFELCIDWVWKIILDIGWVAMVVTQSLVLYSRLGLILRSDKILAAVKWMIIFNSVVICTIVLVFDFGNRYSPLGSFDTGYYYVEQIQMTIFNLQELIISGLYIWKTVEMLRVIQAENTRSMIWQLFIINIIIMCMDVGLVTLQFLHYQLYQEVIKGFVYSVKLKLELNILSKLVHLVDGQHTKDRSMTLATIDSTAIAGQMQADIHREMSGQDFAGIPRKPDEKDVLSDIEESHDFAPSHSGSSSQRHDEKDEITRVFSTASRATARTSGRESDLLYADMLRSISS